MQIGLLDPNSGWAAEDIDAIAHAVDHTIGQIMMAAADPENQISTEGLGELIRTFPIARVLAVLQILYGEYGITKPDSGAEMQNGD